MRTYWTRPPKTYDKNTPMPLTIWGQGCGQNGAPESTPMTEGPAADGSVQVELLAPQGNNHCYSAGPDGDDANSPELPYFDQVLAETLANFCIDTTKVFQGGYSSGGWFSALMACNRADKIRGVIGHLRVTNPTNHPYLVEREVKAVGIIVVSSDRGLCGSLNVNVFKNVLA